MLYTSLSLVNLSELRRMSVNPRKDARKGITFHSSSTTFVASYMPIHSEVEEVVGQHFSVMDAEC